MSRTLKPAGLLVSLVLILACGGGGATNRPSVAPSVAPQSQPASEAPTVEASGELPGPASEQPSGEASDEPSAPASGAASGEPSGQLSGSVTLWHTYSSGAGTELDALNEVLDRVRTENPGLQIEVIEQPFDGVFDKYGLEVAGEGGPDLFIAPNDSLGQLARDGTILALDDYLADKLGNATELAVEGSKVEGVLYQVPESLKAVAMYYDTDAVSTPPATTDELMTAVTDGDLKLGLLGGTNIYHEFGWWGAFGGELMDETGRCTADQGGVADAYGYLNDLEAAGATFYPAYDDMANAFKAGDVDVIVDGPWAAGGYVEAVPALGVAPMPEGPAGPALPLTGVDGWLVNPNTADPALAVNVALALTDTAAQETFANTAYHIPADSTVAIDDPISEQFAAAVENGLPRPQNVELNNFWDNFGNALDLVLSQDADPVQAVGDACAAMNEANGK